MIVGERAKELFENEHHYCAEAVLRSIMEWAGIESDQVPSAATGFCSGMSRTCGPCGVVTGAIIAIGMIAGRDNPQDTDKSRGQAVKCYGMVGRVIAAFEEKYGTIQCLELTGCDLSTQAGLDAFKENKVIERCRELACDIAEMAVAELVEEGFAPRR